jgi:ArsR family transcriptional regulator, arsenate/arsenite/antimonite-responsive transcriptional repressor
MSDLFDSLADSTRRDILTLLRSRHNTTGEMSVGELVEALGITQPTVSKHLKVLRESGIVLVREEGQHRYYRVDENPLRELSAWIGGDSAALPGGVTPFVDLEIAGRATGSLVKDVLEFIEGLRSKLFR